MVRLTPISEEKPEMNLLEWFELPPHERPGLRHTATLRKPTRWESFVRWLSGRYPESYVQERLTALYLDEAEMERWNT
jgi:hypothetical protein